MTDMIGPIVGYLLIIALGIPLIARVTRRPPVEERRGQVRAEKWG